MFGFAKVAEKKTHRHTSVTLPITFSMPVTTEQLNKVLGSVVERLSKEPIVTDMGNGLTVTLVFDGRITL